MRINGHGLDNEVNPQPHDESQTALRTPKVFNLTSIVSDFRIDFFSGNKKLQN